MKKIYAFCRSLLLIAPLSGAQMGFLDDQKSPDTSDHYTISNPLVLLIGIQEYPDCANLGDLPGVESDMKILFKLFAVTCGYEVRSTYHEGPCKVGKIVRKKDLDRFLRLQYNYLHDQRDVYDALIFVFSGHGEGTCYGNDTIITSDGKERFFMDVVMKFTPKDDEEFSKCFSYKPKLFFKLACRGNGIPNLQPIRGKKVVYKDNDYLDTNSEVFISCASASGAYMFDYVGGKYSTLLSNLILSEKGGLSEIDRKIRIGLKGQQVTETITRLNNKVFFSTRIERKPLDEATKEKWWMALKNSDSKVVRYILAHYIVDINAKKYSCTPLHLAACFNSKEVAEILVQYGANIEAKDEYEKTPLHWSAENNSKEVAKILIQHNANIDAKDDLGETPLHNAAEDNSTEVARLLINAGADKNAKDNNNKTPLDCANRRGSKGIIDLLDVKQGGIFSFFWNFSL
ncbi:MAG: ankyrin repeat domain-containing protein [Bacteroidota bacterium]